MKKSSLWKMVCVVCMFCAATAIASPAQTLTTLHNFAGPEGATPSAPMVLASDGNFYGTTIYGGAHGAGAVFKITPSGTLSLLYSFCSVHGYYGCADGNAPLGMVQGRDGNFYGVADQGGELNYAGGTIFKLTPSGALTTLYSFCGIADCTAGQSPTSIMQASDGNLYGVMANAGYNGLGDFYQMTTSGTFTELYDFDGSAGKRPQTPLVEGHDGNLYGTAPSGGFQGAGTVFKISLSGNPTLLYNFCSQPNCTDGGNPSAGLVLGTDGYFYGTTTSGGAYDGGTIFKITPNGALTVLHSFNRPDGINVNAPLVEGRDGNFYGTASADGANNDGTVFQVTPSGAFTNLYSFSGPDGSTPDGGLIQTANGNFYGTTYSGGANNDGTVFKFQVLPTLTVSTSGDGTVTSTDGFISCPGTCTHTYSLGAQVTLNATPSQGWVFGGWNGACVGTSSCTVTMTQSLSVDGIFSQAQQFVAATPCRLIDTRLTGGPIQGGTSRSFPIPQEGGCNIPTTAAAYSLNVSAVPQGSLAYLTIWPTGESRPVVATLNSLDGRIKADAAIVPAGTSGAVSVYVTNTSNVVLDINGYFEPVSGSTLAFYPLTPCRIADTRKTNFPQGLGAPFLPGQQERDFPILNATTCNIPASAVAYSLNFSVVPHGGLGYMTVWPTGQTRPLVSTLNDVPGTIIANAAIVPAGTSGEVSVFPSNDTDVIIDINGYFAPAGPGGLSLYPAAPCRVIDTRHIGNGQPFSGTLTPPVDVVHSPCEPPVTAQAYVFNATVVPTGGLGYLTLWPDGQTKPLVSTLNALDGSITNNMAIVPSTNGKVDAFASGITQLILDISSYFAP